MSIKNILLSIALTLSLAMPAFAEPSYEVSSWSTTFKEGITKDMVANATKEMAEKEKPITEAEFVLRKIKDADLKLFAESYPEATELSIADSAELTSLAPLANLKNLKILSINVEHIADLSALLGLTALEHIKVNYKGEGQDLKWMSKLTNLNKVEIAAKGLSSLEGIPSAPAVKEFSVSYAVVPHLDFLVKGMPNIEDLDVRYSNIADLTSISGLANLKEFNAYGATVKDFSPLVANPKLELVYYYAVKEADFSSLGKLKQVKSLNGGLTSLSTIEWMQDMPNLKEISFFSETVTDYTPLKNAPNLEKLHLWSMKKPLGDLAFLSTLPNLKELTIDSMEGVTNFDALSHLQRLEELTLNGNNEDEGLAMSLTSLAKLKNIKDIYITEEYVESIDVKGLPMLYNLVISEANVGENQKALDLANVKDLPELRKLDLSESNVTNFNALANMPMLTTLNLAKTQGITDLNNLKAFPKLTNLTVSKDAFTAEQLAVLPATVRITQR